MFYVQRYYLSINEIGAWFQHDMITKSCRNYACATTIPNLNENMWTSKTIRNSLIAESYTLLLIM